MTEVLHAPYATGWASLPAPRRQPETAALREKIARLEAEKREWRAEKRKLKAELDQARHCPVTGLWTRRAWEEEALRIVAGGPAVILLADLDQFKPINDRFGHEAGDEVLRIVGRRLTAWCGPLGAVAGRLGGDEFAVALPAIRNLKPEIGHLRVTLTTPVQHRGHSVSVGVSIGVGRSACSGSGDAAGWLSAALGVADRAMYEEKATHHGGVVRDRRGRPVAPPGPVPVSGVDPVPVTEE